MTKGKSLEASKRGEPAKARSDTRDIQAFLKQANETNPQASGRLAFALDATMSRQPTWDRACSIHASMFEATGKSAGLAVQLVYFRGAGECRASKWVINSGSLLKLMTGIECRGGKTQIGKVLRHVARENEEKPVAAMVFIGDAMEEDIDHVCHLAGKLGIRGTKAFMFQEGHDPVAETAFHEIARLTRGAFMRLSEGSARELEELLSAVAIYASGGKPALAALKGKGSRALLQQLKD